jgi:hypothetical protein
MGPGKNLAELLKAANQNPLPNNTAQDHTQGEWSGRQDLQCIIAMAMEGKIFPGGRSERLHKELQGQVRTRNDFV